MSTAHSLELPRRLQVEFSRIVQRHTDTYGGEINAATLWKIFADEYLPTSAAPGLEPWGRFEMRSSQVSSIDDEHVELVQRRDEGVDRPVPEACTLTISPLSMSVALSSTLSSSMDDTCEERISKRPHGSRPGAALVGRYSSAKICHSVAALISPP